MKLIIRQYLASLRERNELDALLPDLLSQMGLTVFSRPRRGTRQSGVDVAAVGAVDEGPERVYLLSIKAGDITRSSWNSEGLQSLRPSLDQIRDSYIRNRLPKQHKNKNVVICLCCGGEIQEQVREEIRGYIDEHSTQRVSYEEWNGDKLAELIQTNFLREDLLPADSRPLLRKALALLDEPEASYGYFNQLLTTLSNTSFKTKREKLTCVRQMYICLWILFAWARDAENLESAYLSSERALLLAWELGKDEFPKTKKVARSIQEVVHSIFFVYCTAADEYIGKKILPHVEIYDGLSSAVRPSSSIDVNIRLFDLLGRIALFGLWATWSKMVTEDEATKEALAEQSQAISISIKSALSNNSVLLLPIKDDQAIDISIALLQLATSGDNTSDVRKWLLEMVSRARFAYEGNGQYPCTIRDYMQLLDHPDTDTADYRSEVTEASILYPSIALWAAILADETLYDYVSRFKTECLQHCNFHLWYPDEHTETYLYTNKDVHGTVLSGVPVDQPMDEFLKLLFRECDETEHFENISAQIYGMWPVILIACRHYRIPVPIHFMTNLYKDR